MLGPAQQVQSALPTMQQQIASNQAMVQQAQQFANVAKVNDYINQLSAQLPPQQM